MPVFSSALIDPMQSFPLHTQSLCIAAFLAATALVSSPLTRGEETAVSETDRAALRVLRDECMGCHKPGKAKGGLLLTSREKAIAGGDNGAAILPGDPLNSLLYQVLLPDADDHMPPKKQLEKAAMNAVMAWIKNSAPWDTSVFDEPPAVRPVEISELPDSWSPVLALSLSPAADRLAVARAGSLDILDISGESPALVKRLPPAGVPLQSVAWSPDGATLAAGGFRRVIAWSAVSSEEVWRVETGLLGPVQALVFSTDGKHLFAGDGETGGLGFIHQIDVQAARITATRKAHDDNINAMAISQDGSLLATAGADKLARIWKTSDLSLSAFFEGHTNHLTGISFNHDASRIATASADREVKIWDVATREQDAILGNKKTAFTALAWSPDGKSLVTIDEKGGSSVYTDFVKHTGAQRSEAAKEKKLEAAAGAAITSVVITPDSKTVLAGDFDGGLHLWDVASAKRRPLELDGP
jgi:WD40 repeat protein